MKKLLVVAGASLLASCASIEIPYFEKLDPKYVCGGSPSPDCQPTSSRKYSKVSDLDFDGNPSHYLGRSFEYFFERNKCVDVEVSENDVVISGYQEVTGKLKNNTKTDFSNKISTDIVSHLRRNNVPVPNGFEADISNEVARRVDNKDTNSIKLEYKRIDLSTKFIDDHLANCQAKTPKKQKISTGISVITVSGRWTSKRLTETFASIEAKASYRTLSNEAKASYENAKDRILDGSFAPVSYIFAVAHREGKE